MMSKAAGKAVTVTIDLGAGVLYLGFKTGWPLSYKSRSTCTEYKKKTS
jgi:hypothetical protein